MGVGKLGDERSIPLRFTNAEGVPSRSKVKGSSAFPVKPASRAFKVCIVWLLPDEMMQRNWRESAMEGQNVPKMDRSAVADQCSERR